MASGGVVPISPTYLSSDLLSPAQIRATAPSIGYQPVVVPPLGGRTWGENVTNYGGIGKKPFLGRARARDLYVSRSHRHYSSGFSTYDTAVQPAQVTSLLKSGCRINDQLIPQCLQVPLDPIQYTRPQQWPVDAYFSHTSRFEVFPCNDQHRPQPDGSPVLSEITQEALTDYYHNVFERPSYTPTFPDNTDVIRRRYGRCASAEKEREPEVSDTADSSSLKRDPWEICLLEGVINSLGPARRHCCFKDILLKVFEYEGSETLKAVVEKLFDGIKNLDPSCRARFKHYFGDNADHIMSEILQLYEHLGQNINGILDLVAFHWKRGEATRNMTDFAAFQCLLDNVNRGCRGKQDTKPEREVVPDLDIAQEAKKGHDAYLDALYQSLADGNKQEPCSTSHTVHGAAPLWPPGSYITNKPWMTLQCTESYPTRAGDEFKRKKTMVDSLYLPSRPKVPKQVAFSEGVSESGCGVDDIGPPRHGFPRYKGYLDDILPVNIDWDLERQGPETQKPPSPTPHFAQLPLPSPPNSPRPTNTPRPASPGLFLLSPPLPATSTTPGPLPPPLQLSPRASDAWSDTAGMWEELPDVTSPTGKKRLPPLPLAATLEPTGDRIQDRLGLCFKTQAHKRFHALYPDDIPDLRDNCRSLQNNIFFGYHGTIFRGNTQTEIIKAHA